MQSFIIGVSTFLISFYTLQFQDINGNTISMSNFQGRKVLIVNFATGSARINQLQGLKELQQQFHDSLVVIAFPSNSFGREPRTNSEIKAFCDSAFNPNFIIASKTIVKGSGIHPLFEWLADSSKNGDQSATTINDYQKFLVSPTGSFVGVISPKLNPMDSIVLSAINRVYE